jgi:hypothetical protein
MLSLLPLLIQILASLSVPTPIRVHFDESPTPTVPTLDGSQPTHQMSKSSPFLLPSQVQLRAAAAEIQGMVASGMITMPYPSSEATTSPSPLAAVSLLKDPDSLLLPIHQTSHHRPSCSNSRQYTLQRYIAVFTLDNSYHRSRRFSSADLYDRSGCYW